MRALHLGDMLCAVPALRSLRAGHPDAHVTLVGLPWARALLPHLRPYVDEVREFPGWPGIPERELDARRVTDFLREMQEARLDLAVQLHGSGSHINEFVALLGAREAAGFAHPGDATTPGGTWIPWPAAGTEARRLLELPRALGCPDTGDALEWRIGPEDRTALRVVVGDALDGGFAVIHPGARFPSRRWGAERFAAAADALAERGLRVAITGTTAEAEVTAAVRDAMRAPAVDLTGRLTLATLAALVRGATLVVCNDTGMSHVAAAVGTPSVVIASGSEVARWRPHDAGKHRVLWHDVPCRPCEHVSCPIGHPCAAGVEVDAVIAALDGMMPRTGGMVAHA